MHIKLGGVANPNPNPRLLQANQSVVDNKQKGIALSVRDYFDSTEATLYFNVKNNQSVVTIHRFGTFIKSNS